jgi:hypothetical protein
MNKQISDHVSKTASVEGLSIFYREAKRLVQTPAQNRGQVAAQEQIKILREALANETEQAPPPQNRGQVAAQEQFRIIREALGISNT